VELALQVVSQESVAVMRCRGRLVYGQESDEFVRTLRQLLDTTQRIVLQLADVTQIDSGGVGALGGAFVTAHRREAEIKLAALSPRVAEVLRITALDRMFDIHGSETDAIDAFIGLGKERSGRGAEARNARSEGGSTSEAHVAKS
jgi:anti-sigma B factor antagonist